MGRVYATEADYQGWSEDSAALVPARVLVGASLLVEEVTAGAVYATDPATYLPTDSAVVDAFRDATCAVVQFRLANGDPNGAGLPKLKSATIGKAAYTLQDTPSVDTASLPVEAARILRGAGLLERDVLTYG